MQNISDQQLTAKARQYDRINNEGGEGFNPYTQELNRRAHAAETNRPKSTSEVRDAIMQKLERLDCTVARESGTYNQTKIDALKAELAEVNSQADGAFATEWTKDVTIARRAEWNGFVKSLMDSKGRIADGRAIYQQQANQGWGTTELKRAVKLHSL